IGAYTAHPGHRLLATRYLHPAERSRLHSSQYREAGALPVPLPVTRHRRAFQILDLQPVPGSARLVGLRESLRDDPLEPHAAGLLEHQLAARVGMVDHGDSDEPAIDEARQTLLTLAERQGTVVYAVQLEHIEHEQHCLGDCAAPMECIEDGDSIRPAHRGL